MSAMLQPRNRALSRALALAGTFIALASAASAQALTANETATSPPASSATVPSCCGRNPTVANAPTAGTPSRHSRRLSTEEIVIAALAALLALGCATWGIARRRAFEPRWTLSLRHATAEAGFRASATWAEFADWIRLGH
jgi:hypothetical protein